MNFDTPLPIDDALPALTSEWRGKSAKVALSPLFDDFVTRHYQQVIDYAFENKLIRRKFPVTDLLEPRFDDEVIRELGLTAAWTPFSAHAATP